VTTEQKQRTEAEKKDMARIMGGELIELKIELFSPYVDFMKEYLAFFGAKKSLEDLCREIIYEQVGYLYNELHDFADKSHFLDSQAWYAKHPYVACTSVPEEETEN
jgi:hypothetical protein